VSVDGFELAYDRTGSGPAVVLLHGWPGDRTDYRAVVPLLAGCQVLVPDLRTSTWPIPRRSTTRRPRRAAWPG
jgi:pimeloyl-ACP methyl ester carboxylesterase